jgi:hypothetical protein
VQAPAGAAQTASTVKPSGCQVVPPLQRNMHVMMHGHQTRYMCTSCHQCAARPCRSRRTCPTILHRVDHSRQQGRRIHQSRPPYPSIALGRVRGAAKQLPVVAPSRPFAVGLPQVLGASALVPGSCAQQCAAGLITKVATAAPPYQGSSSSNSSSGGGGSGGSRGGSSVPAAAAVH